ncbi:AsmA family protein, partial [Vibrio cholerae O1]|nr:AsmA family protein [Vibrio cholerae O1]
PFHPAGLSLGQARKEVERLDMTKTGKITTSVIGVFLLLIVVLIIVIAKFDWNRLKPTINQKVSTELNRPFAIRG